MIGASSQVNSDIAVILLARATSVKTVVANILKNVNEALKIDLRNGIAVANSMRDIYLQQIDYMVQGVSQALSDAAGLMSEVQAIVMGGFKETYTVEDKDYRKFSVLKVSNIILLYGQPKRYSLREMQCGLIAINLEHGCGGFSDCISQGRRNE